MRLKKPQRYELMEKIFRIANLSRGEEDTIYYFSLKNLMELILILERQESKLRKEESDAATI
jgi:hypothetical protein